MPKSLRKTLVVIGAGPKGIATAVKAKVLEEFGLPVDRVVLIERHNVAANWSGEFGYTNGKMKLGTSPEKDVVFPLETDIDDRHLNQRIKQRLLQFTWMSFLVQTGRFSDWVDRGRPAPCHLLWTDYLRWVSAQLEPHVSILSAEVTAIGLNTSRSCWELNLKNTDGEPNEYTLEADRLMLTGPGKTRMDFLKDAKIPNHAYDLESFWAAIKNRKFEANGRIAIIGAGENAASALLAISQYAPNVRVDIISPKGFISTRAESYYENQIYSQPERNQWTTLDLKDRIDFIERTDLGVFSTHAMNILNERLRHQIIPGRVENIIECPDHLSLEINYAGLKSLRDYEQVILASGFDQMSTLKKILTAEALKYLEQALGEPLTQSKIAASIQPDLSVGGLTPTLHLPMLAGLIQGPGFANLSCLGRLSDRIVTLPTLEKMKTTSPETHHLTLLDGVR
jgi:mycobactin lysine-N-oxygenase